MSHFIPFPTWVQRIADSPVKMAWGHLRQRAQGLCVKSVHRADGAAQSRALRLEPWKDLFVALVCWCDCLLSGRDALNQARGCERNMGTDPFHDSSRWCLVLRKPVLGHRKIVGSYITAKITHCLLGSELGEIKSGLFPGTSFYSCTALLRA